MQRVGAQLQDEGRDAGIEYGRVDVGAPSGGCGPSIVSHSNPEWIWPIGGSNPTLFSVSIWCPQVPWPACACKLPGYALGLLVPGGVMSRPFAPRSPSSAQDRPRCRLPRTSAIMAASSAFHYGLAFQQRFVPRSRTPRWSGWIAPQTATSCAPPAVRPWRPGARWPPSGSAISPTSPSSWPACQGARLPYLAASGPGRFAGRDITVIGVGSRRWRRPSGWSATWPATAGRGRAPARTPAAVSSPRPADARYGGVERGDGGRAERPAEGVGAEPSPGQGPRERRGSLQPDECQHLLESDVEPLAPWGVMGRCMCSVPGSLAIRTPGGPRRPPPDRRR